MYVRMIGIISKWAINNSIYVTVKVLNHLGNL